MSAPTNRPCPKMLRHSSGQAYAAWKVKGKRYHRFFGLWGSNAAWVAYDLFTRYWPEPLLNPSSPRPRPAPRLLTHDGRTQNLTAWARQLGVKPGTLRHRLDVLHWPTEKALTTPARPHARTPKLFHDTKRSMGFVRWTFRGKKRLVKYLGAWGTTGLEVEYAKFLAEWEAAHPEKAMQAQAQLAESSAGIACNATRPRRGAS